MTIESLYQIYLQHPGIQTDTRKLEAGDLFFALNGPNFNGNEFVQAALDKGAAYAVIDEATAAVEGKTILVADVLTTLQQLAGYHRDQFTIPVLAITGSNGKTTSKELISAVLSTHMRTYTTEGNLNNHIGVPLTLLRLKKDAQIAVIEMGANHKREIAGYCEYTRPTHGLITNVGKAHLEGFGGEEGVRIGKGELFDFLREHDGTAFIMNDYEYLREMSKGIQQVITYGSSAENDVSGVAEASDPFLVVRLKEGKLVQSQLVGDYNLANVLAAVSVGRNFGVPEEKIIAGIEAYTPSNSRSQMVNAGSNRIILDAYNANPSSMRSAIENFGRLAGENKLLFLGSMAELGPESRAEHEALIKLIGQYEWNDVILVGEGFSTLHHPYRNFPDSLEAGKWFREAEITNSLILVKGSRSTRMERVIG
jgi:UDP-N-acetylmuramoyl-tripeptide--D-alanyl-D-alanine ligase